MVDYKRILRLRAEGVSQRGIADVMGCSRNTVSAVFTAADAAGIGTRSSTNSTAGGWRPPGHRCTSSATLASRSRSTGRAIR